MTVSVVGSGITSDTSLGIAEGNALRGKRMAQGVKSEQRAVKTVLSVKSLVLREDLSVNNHHISSVEILL